MRFGAFGAIWIHLKPFGVIWSHLETYGASWSHLESFGAGQKNIFGRKLRNPYFCHIFGMERPFVFVKKGMYHPGLVFYFGLTEKLGRCKKS